MFKKLKDKIAEEVKQSPLKSVQQLAQAVVSPSSSSVFEPSSSNDKFCIEEGDIEEDEKQEQSKPGGFTSVTLTGQTTSPVRDQNQRYGFRSSSGSLMAEADNLFPKFEPQPTNFHVQSDWESASEVEDRYSQLEHINKESLYEAYRKVYNRYNRIKNKYHEIVTHYRQLEREKEKAKTVLAETQDKALLRISELREQCLLEQQAKAHLEEALRNELEERDHIINTLRTKVQYLKGVSDSSAAESLSAAQLSKEDRNLIDFTENLSVSSTVPLPFDASSSEEKINWFEEKLKTLKNLLNEETVKVEQLKSKLTEAKKESCDPNNINLENVDGSEPLEHEQITEKELIGTLTELITKLTTEVQHLHKSAVNYSIFNSVNGKESLELRLADDGHGNFTGSENGYDVQNVEMNRYIVSIKQLEEQNKILSETLQEERFTAKELKNELNTLSSLIDILKKKIKLSNENFGKNDAINCLINDVENELIHEWNSCFKNFLQTRCEITVLKDTREDLEKELLRITEEKNKSELLNKEITEKNYKLKEDIDILQKELKSYLIQLENVSKERSYLKMSSENFEKQIKKLEETLAHSEKANSGRQEDVQKVINEKTATETKLSNLELELQNTKSEYILLLKTKQKLDVEVESLRKENSEMISVNEALNNKVNEVENKLKQVEDDYKTVMDTRDGLDNQINFLTKETEELESEKSAYCAQMLDLEKELENIKLEQVLFLDEKDILLSEIKCLKDDYELVNKERLSITDRFHGLVKELENYKHNYSKSVESARQHSDELVSLKEEINKLTLEKCSLESKIVTLNKDIENLKSNCRLDEEVQLRLSEELSSVTEERDNLLSEIQSVQNRTEELVSASKVINEELSLIKKENTGLTAAKNNMQEEIQRLEECLKSNEENYSSLSKINMTLTEELDSLKKEKEGLVKEKSTLENLSKTLEDDLTTSKEKLSRLSEEYDNVAGKLQVLRVEYNELASKKQTEQDSTEKIKYYLKENEEKLLLISQEKNKFVDEIETLKNEFDQIEKEHKLLQDRYDRIVAEYENNKELTASLTVIKDTMSTEIDSLKKDNENTFDKLNKTIAEVEKQQNINSELEDQVCSLSESLKNKSDEANEKCQENIKLKREINLLNHEIEDSNDSIEKLTSERNHILNYVIIKNMCNVKRIKEQQEYLCEFVRQFQAEISREINDISFQMGHLLKHLNDLLGPETCSTKLTELECRSKKFIDSYNCKLKNLQGPSNTTEEVLQVTATDLESSNPVEKWFNDVSCKTVKFRRMGHLEKADMDNCISYDHNVHEPEAYLKQAISLMKSFTNLLNHNSVSSEDLLNNMFTDHSNNEKYIRLNEIESQNLQKEIVAMESFITDYETKYNETDSSRVLIHMLKETDNNYSNYSEMQLRQELSLKEDIIKKLQSVIEDYEQKKVRDENEAVNSEKTYVLEQENKSLSEKLQQIQDTHELNLKNIISEYEKKLKEIEEDNNLYDLEKLDKEKKFMVNEMKEQIQNLQQDLEERGDAFEKLYEEHHQSVKNVDKEIHQMRNNHDKELREQDKKWRQCLDRRLAEEETRHQQELASLNMQWNAERRELETARRLAVNAVESGSGSNELLRRQVQALTVQLSELRSHRCEACDRKRSVGGQEHEIRSIQDCTEMEYLRNILYEYMMGKEPLVLAKVLCALVKFDENQTKEVVSKEEHRITLFGQLGLL